MTAIPLGGGTAAPVLAHYGAESRLKWSPDGRWILISMPTSAMLTSGRTFCVPLSVGRVLPQIPAEGFHSGAEIAGLTGTRVIDAFDVAPDPSFKTYAFARETVQRNLYRIPLP